MWIKNYTFTSRGASGLYYVSEEVGIERFTPRDRTDGPAVVWAIDRERLSHYLLPRDCPRVCYWPLPESDPDDVTRLLGPTAASKIIVIESAWLPRIRATRLYLHHLPASTFVLEDDNAGYWVSNAPVEPTRVDIVDDLLGTLCSLNVDLRFTPSLWPIRDAVVKSSLGFSTIRLRNAAPRPSSPLHSGRGDTLDEQTLREEEQHDHR